MSEEKVFYLEREGEILHYQGLPWGTSEEHLAWFLAWALHKDGDKGWAVEAYHQEPLPEDFVILAQRDPQWKNSKLGYDWSAADSTIGNWGCVVTSIAMMMQVVMGKMVTPPEVNARMVEVEGFGGNTGNLVIWSKVAEAYPEVRLAKWVICDKVAAPVGDMRAWINAGNFCIFQVDINPADLAVQGHYLLLTEIPEDLLTGSAADPWTGRVVTIPPAYVNPSWSPNNLARAIFKVAFYEKTG